MSVLERLAHRSVSGLVRGACVFALAAVVTMTVSILFPGPLVVILAMSVGHVLILLALVLYILAVTLDTAGRDKGSPKSGKASPTRETD